MAIDPDAAAVLARRHVDEGVPWSDGLDGETRRALAWALKDLCYASWNSDPARAVRAARALGDLAAADTRPPASSVTDVGALAEWTAGIARVVEGDMAAAIDAFDRAAAAFVAAGRADAAAQTQVPRIMALSMLGRHDEAAQCAEAAQRAFVSLGDRRAAGRVSLNLGTLHWRRGAYALAARHSREAVLLFARVGDMEHSVMADIGLADALTALGDTDEASRIYARARMRADAHGFPVLAMIVEESAALLALARGRYREALAGLESARRGYEQRAMPQQLAVAEKQLADVYLELRLLPEALALFDQALGRFAALNLPDEQAWTLTQRGRAEALTGQVGSAAASFSEAAALFEAQANALGGSAVSLARAELALAGGDAAAALAAATRASSAFADAGLAERQLRADAVCARALLGLGDTAGAAALYDVTLQAARELQCLPVQVQCLTGVGLAARSVGDAGAAGVAFESAIELFEEQRRVLPGDDLRGAFLTDHLVPYQELLRNALDGAAAAAPGAAGAAWRQLERVRARTLGERLLQREHAVTAGVTADLRTRLNWLHRRVQRLQDEDEPAESAREELHRTERELLEQARRERLTGPLPAVNDDDPGADDLSALPSRLEAREALVEYGVLDDELFACIVTGQGVRLQRRLASWRETLEAIASARFQIETLGSGAPTLQTHLARLQDRVRIRMTRLHALLWAPLDEALSGIERVLVVPHAQLGAVPFAALHDGAQFIGQRLAIALAPSGRVALRGLAGEAPPIRRVLAFGESSRLAHAGREAELVAALHAQSQVFVDDEVTLATLAANAPQADLIHFACHAQFRGDNPMFSALHLHDGVLTVEATEALRLQAGLVVLGACETALSSVASGDEMVGLVRAFLVAGARRVLASLWPVDDAATLRFMAAFHRALCRGDAPSAAVQRAQDEVRATHPHPFYWAAFTLHGGW